MFDNARLLWHYVVGQNLAGLALVHGFPRWVAVMPDAIAVVIVWAAHFARDLRVHRARVRAADGSGWFRGCVGGMRRAAALLALAAIAVPAGIRASRGLRVLPDRLALGLGGLALVAVVWEASSLIWVPACG